MSAAITITAEGLERAEKILANVPHGAERAAKNAINRGLSRVKTSARKHVKEIYTVQAGALSAATNTKVKNAGGDLVGYVNFSGSKIPLYKFYVTPKRPGTGQQVFASVMRGSGATLGSAFIANMSETGVFERIGKPRFPVEQKMGLAAAQMVGNEKVIEPVSEEAQKLVNERLEHEIERLLNGG